MNPETNRANAQLSTGPRTPEGKAASSLNSTTHGLSGNRISRKNPEAQARYQQRRQDYAVQYPHDAALDRLQADLIDALATARTRMELVEEAQDALPDETATEYQTLQRYWREADRAFSRTLRLLQNHRAQPAAEARRQKTVDNREHSRILARQRLFFDVKRLEYEAITKEICTPDAGKAAQLASFRQRLKDLPWPGSQEGNPMPQNR